MATIPNTSVLDTTDITTLNLLQQAQNLATLSNNSTLASAIAAATQAALLTGNVSNLAFSSIGGGGIPPGTGGGTPVGPTITTPSTTQQGGFTNPTLSPGTGGSVGTPINPGTAGPPTTIGGGTIGGGGIGVGIGGPFTPVLPGTPGGGTTDPCANPTYRIGKIKELNGGLNNSSTPDFSGLGKQCILIGQLIKCCPAGETIVGWVELGRSKSSEFYKDCPDGGKQPVVEQYYEMVNIGPVLPYLVAENTDAVGNLNVVGTVTNVNRWSDTCGISNSVLTSPNQGKIYESFSEYSDAKWINGITIGNESRVITPVQTRYASNSPTQPNVAVEPFIRAVKASCGGSGTCTTTVIPKNCPDPNIDTNYVKELSRVPFSTETIISTETNPTPDPSAPCFVGNKQTYRIESGYTVTNATICSDGTIGATKTMTVTDSTQTLERWINTVRNENSENCNCVEVAVPNDTYTDPSDPCGCYELVTDTIYIVCSDEPNYPNIGPNSKKSTAIYNLPGQPGIRLVSKIQRADCNEEAIKVYHPLILGKDVISGKVKSITKGLFNLSQSLDCYYTSSTQNSSSKSHYYEITDCDTCGKTPYFAVAYGNQLGSGSLYSQGDLFDTTTKAVYSQYRLIALEAPERFFKFYTNGQTNPNTKDVYVINYYRNGLSDRIDPGNFEINLAELRGGSYGNNFFTGSNVAVSSSNKVISLIDNSMDRDDTYACSEDPYTSYDLVSGSLNNGIHNSGTGSVATNPDITTYGTVYPNLGIIVLDPHKLNTQLGFNTVTGSNISGDNAFKLHTAISGAASLGYPMKARNVKYKTTNHYFVRVASPFANYSNNPTFVTGSSLTEDNGKFAHKCFEKEPQTYITTIGLYNNNKDLLAVAKLSKPVKKTSDNDVLIKIRLNW
jgi:hypothetical protein